jgi:hypothetical protein
MEKDLYIYFLWIQLEKLRKSRWQYISITGNLNNKRREVFHDKWLNHYCTIISQFTLRKILDSFMKRLKRTVSKSQNPYYLRTFSFCQVIHKIWTLRTYNIREQCIANFFLYSTQWETQTHPTLQSELCPPSAVSIGPCEWQWILNRNPLKFQ